MHICDSFQTGSRQKGSRQFDKTVKSYKRSYGTNM